MAVDRAPLLPGSNARAPKPRTDEPKYVDGELSQWHYPTDGETPCEERPGRSATGDASGGLIDDGDSPSGYLPSRHFGRTI